MSKIRLWESRSWLIFRSVNNNKLFCLLFVSIEIDPKSWYPNCYIKKCVWHYHEPKDVCILELVCAIFWPVEHVIGHRTLLLCYTVTTNMWDLTRYYYVYGCILISRWHICLLHHKSRAFTMTILELYCPLIGLYFVQSSWL